MDRGMNSIVSDRYGGWPLVADAGVTVARPRCRILLRLGARDLDPRVPGWWRPLVFACRSSGAAWSVALIGKYQGEWAGRRHPAELAEPGWVVAVWLVQAAGSTVTR